MSRSKTSRWDAVRRLSRRTSARIAAGVLLLGAVLWIVVATGLGMSLLLPAALDRAVPEGWTVEVGSVDGAWHSRVRLHDLTLQGPSTSVTVEEVLVDYSLLPLFSRTIELTQVRVLRPRVRADLTAPPSDTARAAADESGGLGDLLSGSPLGAWALDLDDLEVRQAEATLVRQQGTYAVSEARLTGSAELAPSGVRVRVDTLAAQVTPPRSWAPADSLPRGGVGTGMLLLAADLQDGLLDVQTLSFESPRSHLNAAGRLFLVAEPSLVDSVDFQLVADPLDLRDLPVTLPDAWADQPRLTAQITARGAVDSMVVQANVDGPGETAAQGRAVLRTPADTLFEDVETRTPTLELTADVRGNLAPWSLGPLSGDVTAELDLRLDSLSLTAPLAAEATLVHRPAADTLSGLIGGDLRVDLDLRRGAVPAVPADTPAAEADGRAAAAPIEAAAAIYRRGVGPDDWTRVGDLRATGTERRADWHVDLELDSGSLVGRGSAEWAGERTQVIVDRLQMEDFDASELMGTLTPTDITALLEGSIAGAAARELSGTVAIQISPSSIGGARVENATLRAQLDRGEVAGAVMADVAGRELSSDFELALGDSLVSATLERLRVSTPADTAEADTAEVVLSGLEVRGRASGTWFLGDARRATLSLSLDSALVAGFPLSDGIVEGRLVGDSLVADASLRVLDVLSAPASVEASLRASGTAPAEMVGRLEMSAVRAPAGDTAAAVVREADSLSLVVTAEEPGRFAVDASLLPGEGGGVDVNGTALVAADTVAFDLVAAGSFRSPTGLLQQATLDTLRLEASGARNAEAWEALQAQLLVRNAEWRGVTADTVRLVMSADDAGLRVDTVAVDSEVLTLAGGGTLPQSGAEAGHLDFRASFQLEPLQDVLEAELPLIGENAMVATITGTTDSLEIATQLEIAAVSYGSIEIADVSAEAMAVVEPPFSEDFGIVSVAADLELDAIALSDTDVQNLAASLSGSPDSLLLEISARVDGTRTGDLVASIDPRPGARIATIDRFRLQLDEDQWRLADSARISYADGYALRSFHLAAGEQSIRIDGGITGDGALDLTVGVDSTRVGTVSDLLGFPRLDGWLAGTVSLDGTVDAPRGVADLRAGFHPEGRPPTTAAVHLETEGRRLLTDAALRDPTGGTLTVTGSLPLGGAAVASGDTARAAQARAPADATATEGGLALEVTASAFDVSSAVAFVDPELLSTLDGRIDASLDVGGSLEAPSFQGPIELSGGRARLPELGVTWEEMRLFAHGQGSQLVVDSARVRAGSGYLAFAGTATVVDSVVALDLDASLEEFQAIQNEQYRAVVSGDLQVDGTVQLPVVEGDIQVVSLDVYLGESATATSVMDVELSEEDLEILRERFGYVPGSANEDVPVTDYLTADLTVELSRDSWLRKRTAPEMAVAFSGEVEVQLRPQAEPLLRGSVTTIADRGYVQQFGKRFELREGTVTLDGPPDSARVDLSATYTIPSHTNPDNAEATIVLSVEGTQDNLVLTLSSEPPMENADIVSYVATGRPAASSLSLGDGGADQAGEESQGGLAEAGAGIALNQIVGAVERAAQEGVGLDVVEIRRDGIRSATLVAGKYLSPKLYVGFAQPVTRLEGDGLSLGDESESEVEIEYQMLRGLLLNIEGSNSGLRIFLRGRLAY